MAVKGRYEGIVKLLLDKGADPNSLNSWGHSTPLLRAVEMRHKVIVKLLLDKGADPNLESPRRSRISPFVIATERRYEDIVRLLLEKGATV
ncbi:ankyrin, partial [Thozetella sp. PMI_491]